MENNNNGGSNFLTGFLLGGFIGAAFGLLFAPKPGKDVRSNLRDESEEMYDKAKDELNRLKQELDNLRQKVSETLEKGKSAFKDDELVQEERDFEEKITGEEAENTESQKKKRTKKSE